MIRFLFELLRGPNSYQLASVKDEKSKTILCLEGHYFLLNGGSATLYFPQPNLSIYMQGQSVAIQNHISFLYFYIQR